MTAQQLIDQAIRDICVMRSGQKQSTDIVNDCFLRLNQMIDAWLLDRFLVYQVRADIYSLVTNQQQYTIGPGAFFNTQRPTKLEQCNCIINTTNPVIRQPMDIITFQEWSLIRVATLPNAIPQVIYDDYAFPISTLNIWPGPQTNYGLELYTWQQLTEFADLTTDYLFPPGYARMLRLNLAVEIAPSMRVYFKVQQPLLDNVMAQAIMAKEEVKSYNAPDPLLGVDPSFLGGSRSGSFNWLSGQVGRGSTRSVND